MKGLRWSALLLTLVFALGSFGQAIAQNNPTRGKEQGQKIQRPAPRSDSQRENAAMVAARRSTQSAIRHMQRALPIYQGHRVNAIGICRLAVQDISLGLKYGKSTRPQTGMQSAQSLVAQMPKQTENPARRYTQEEVNASNKRMSAALEDVRKAKTALARAPHDYGGFRTRALQLLTLAEQEILVALQTKIEPASRP